MKRHDPSARPPPYPRDDEGKFKKGKGRVICTHFLRTGKMSVSLWKLDVRFTERMSLSVVRGYHLWAIPYVRLMRKHRWAEALMLPMATWRAQEVAFQMGAESRGSYRGKLVRLVGEPLCWLLGQFADNGEWSVLYKPETKRT